MKQNNRKNTWKEIVAVMLVITSMFTMSSLVKENLESSYILSGDEISTRVIDTHWIHRCK